MKIANLEAVKSVYPIFYDRLSLNTKVLTFLQKSDREDYVVAEILQVRTLKSFLDDITKIDLKMNSKKVIMRSWITFSLNHFELIFNPEEIVISEENLQNLENSNSKNEVLSVMTKLETLFNYEKGDYVNFNLVCHESTNIFNIPTYFGKLTQENIESNYFLRNELNEIIVDEKGNPIYRYFTIVYNQEVKDLLVVNKRNSYKI